jgi:hypothetical protein
MSDQISDDMKLFLYDSPLEWLSIRMTEPMSGRRILTRWILAERDPFPCPAPVASKTKVNITKVSERPSSSPSPVEPIDSVCGACGKSFPAPQGHSCGDTIAVRELRNARHYEGVVSNAVAYSLLKNKAK